MNKYDICGFDKEEELNNLHDNSAKIMNSQELWLRLYDMDTKEIKVETMMMIMFLVNNRGVDIKDFIKDIKNIYKERSVK